MQDPRREFDQVLVDITEFECFERSVEAMKWGDDAAVVPKLGRFACRLVHVFPS